MKTARSLTLGGLAWRQMRARWASFAPTAVGLAVAIALGTAVTLTQSRTEDASLVRTVNGLGSNGLVTVRLTGAREQAAYNQFTADVSNAARSLGGLLSERSVLLYSATYTPKTINGVDVSKLGADYARTVTPLQIAVFENLSSKVDLVSGSWPGSPATGSAIEVTLPEDAARTAHLKLGDRQCMKVLSPGAYGVCIHVAGIWRPRNVADPYWGPEQTVPTAAFTDDASYFNNLKAEAAADPQPQLVSVATVTLSPNVNAIRAVGAATALTDLRNLRGQFGVERPDAVVVSNLLLSLDQFVNQEELAAFAIELVAVQLLLVALYCVWFLAGNLLAQQRQTISVWRSRGWSWRGVSVLLSIELGIAALVAVPVGILGGWLVSEAAANAVYRDQQIPAFHLDVARLGVPIAAVLVAEIVLLGVQAILAGRHGVLRARAATSRPPIPWWRQRYLDVVLAVLAVPLLLQVRVLGSARVRSAGAADDPVNLLLPGIAVAFIALAALRLLPAVAMVLTRIGRGVAVGLASVQLRRAPGQHAGLATLLVLALALGVFASTYSASAARNGVDRAGYAAGADVRGVFAGVPKMAPDDIPISRAAARSSVFRAYARTGSEDMPMLAVDPYSFKKVMYTRDDLASSPLPDLVQHLADVETGGFVLPALPAATRSMSIWVHGANTGGVMTAHLSDAAGVPVHADLGSLDFRGWRQLTAPLVAEGGSMREPLRFRDLAISGLKTPGTVYLSSFAAGDQVIEGFSEDLGGGPGARFFPGLWFWTDPTSGEYVDTVFPTLDMPRDKSRTTGIHLTPGPLPAYLRPGAIKQRLPGFGGSVVAPIPALAPAQLLNRFGLTVGKTIQVEVDHIAVTAVIVGVADHFPTLYPDLGDFLVLDSDPLLPILAAEKHQRPWPNEIWVRSGAAGGAAALASMTAAPGVVQVYDRSALESAAAHSPQQLELTSNLVLGFVSAIALGLLAFAVHFLIVARTRLTDYAVLEANGMSPSVMRRSLLIEQSALLAFCAACGVLLGLVMSYVLLPVLQLGAAPSDNVPQTLVIIDPGLLAVVLGVVVAGGLAAGSAIVTTERPRVMTELRSIG